MQDYKHTKRGFAGVAGQLITLVLAIVVSGIIASYGQQVTGNVGAGFTANSYAANTTTNVQAGVAQITSNYSTLGSVGIAAIIVGLLLTAFGGYFLTRQ